MTHLHVLDHASFDCEVCQQHLPTLWQKQQGILGQPDMACCAEVNHHVRCAVVSTGGHCRRRFLHATQITHHKGSGNTDTGLRA